MGRKHRRLTESLLLLSKPELVQEIIKSRSFKACAESLVPIDNTLLAHESVQ